MLFSLSVLYLLYLILKINKKIIKKERYFLKSVVYNYYAVLLRMLNTNTRGCLSNSIILVFNTKKAEAQFHESITKSFLGLMYCN